MEVDIGLFQNPVIFELAFEDLSIFLCEYRRAILAVHNPLALILGPVGIVETSETLALAIQPISLVSVAENFVGPRLVQPEVDPIALLFVVFPLSDVL